MHAFLLPECRPLLLTPPRPRAATAAAALSTPTPSPASARVRLHGQRAIARPWKRHIRRIEAEGGRLGGGGRSLRLQLEWHLKQTRVQRVTCVVEARPPFAGVGQHQLLEKSTHLRLVGHLHCVLEPARAQVRARRCEFGELRLHKCASTHRRACE